MQFKSSSRRDDLISATYLFLFLLNMNQFPLLIDEQDVEEDLKEIFVMNITLKKQNSLSKMAKNLDNIQMIVGKHY